LTRGATPVASASPWYVVQLEPKPEARGADLELAATVALLAVDALPAVDAAEPVPDEPQPTQQSDAIVKAAPTLASRAALLTAQPE